MRAAIVPLLLLGLMFIAVPAFAQMDFSGEWNPIFYEDQPERVAGPEIGDYTGIPITEAARVRADSWTASFQTLPEWQCRPHSAYSIWRGPSQLPVPQVAEPSVRTTCYRLNPAGLVAPFPWDVVEEITRPKGSVPSWLPGKNPDLTEYATKYGLPVEATRGGPQTMYPEYRSKLK